MPKIFKYLLYLGLFAACFLVFLYWYFPYDALKDRLLGSVEQQIGGGVQVSAKRLKPYWFTGVDLEGLTVEGPGASGGLTELLSVRRVRARASLFSLLFGGTNVHFLVEIGKGEIEGSARVAEDAIALELEAANIDFASMPLIEARTGMKISSKIDGEASLSIDRQQPARSTGTISVVFESLRIAGSEIKVGEMPLTVPDLEIAKGRESQLVLTLGKGTAGIDAFRFVGGDLTLDLKGKVFLSSRFENYRLNLNGSFGASQKLGEALPFLFIVDSQKQEDGSYPLSITGRITKPAVKIGTFSVPM